MNDFRALIDKWPTRTAMGKDMGVSQSLVSQWFRRNNIPAVWWMDLLAQAMYRDIKNHNGKLLTATDLLTFVTNDAPP